MPEGLVMINNKFLLYLLCGVMFSPALALGECKPTQDCRALGYKEAPCPERGVKCPFGETWYCPIHCEESYRYTCTGANESKGEDSCGDKYSACQCKTNYKWNSTSGKCEQIEVLGVCSGAAKNCKIGQILNSDASCTDDKVSGKTPIGVVVAINKNCGYAMTASPIKKGIQWSPYCYSTGGTSTTNTQYAIKDFNVNGNMKNIIQSSTPASKYPAGYAALNYAPNGAPTTKGKWVMPTVGIMESLCANKNAVNNAISKLGGEQLAGDNENIWTSTEFGSCDMWVYWTGTCGFFNGAKSNTYSNNTPYVVRPVIEF